MVAQAKWDVPSLPNINKASKKVTSAELTETIGASPVFFRISWFTAATTSGGAAPAQVKKAALSQGQREERKLGLLLIAPAAYTHTHRGNVPRGGPKYIATSWILFQRAETLFGGGGR